MKDKQRWQPEEDALLCAYVKQYGPNDWNLVSERMATPLDRDPKSCHERWKNYLKPGLKRGPLSEEEQNLVIRLQEKYGNKWKRIAAEVPGRTAKRLGKWWEVHKERRQKEAIQRHQRIQTGVHTSHLSMFYGQTVAPFIPPAQSFSTCAEVVSSSSASEGESQCRNEPRMNLPAAFPPTSSEPVLTLGPTVLDLLPAWKPAPRAASTSELPSLMAPEAIMKPNLSLSLDSGAESGDTDTGTHFNNNKKVSTIIPKDDEFCNEINSDISPGELIPLLGLVKELEENKESWNVQKKNAASTLRELKQQLECERIEKRKQKMLEVESKIQALRKEEKLYLDKLELDYAELVAKLDRDAELKEEKLVESWSLKYNKLVLMFEQTMQRYSSFHGPIFQAIQMRGMNSPA
uniref:PHANTASTICA-like protein n=1 Tax=Selaginella kraussiana TaxID=81964 RepID=Q5GAB4_9TRAC|nr:PHANTASTICA-like protein [Selaginella kraussiana]